MAGIHDRRWQVSFHAGGYGHGDSYASGAAITLNSIQTLTLPTACPYFYSCFMPACSDDGSCSPRR